MKTKNLVYSALLLSLGIILPSLTHTLGPLGTVVLPMHIPVFLSGIIIGPMYGACIGLMLPLLNHFILGMPPIPMLYIMIFELLTYGIISGLVFRKTNNVLISLLVSMISGRIVGALIAFILFYILGLSKISPVFWIYGSIITGLPGIIIQLILIPIISNVIIKNKAK
ncbi:ECF transporter S component [Miniphocaeibacter massiliensis]|uniref:ECF transporter S component n=1 Tax=Miniphocaeibacter massiliensis TaxID=2041841 RepID=UPI000C1BC422|nr:ECF transporter S component [Miniphocaeibacter massiliensis]